MVKSNITFEFDGKSKTSVLMKRDGETIGRIWSQGSGDKHNTPYPHNDSEDCINSVQICGFDRISEIWGCGPFKGKKDCVIHFIPTNHEYYIRKKVDYERYVKGFLYSKKNDILLLQSFDQWERHNI